MQEKICIVIPCYKVELKIKKVVLGLPDFIDSIILIDDCSPDRTYKILQDLAISNPKVTLMQHTKNMGVGGAMITGFKEALKSGCSIIIKMDGDDQMDPLYLPDLIEPLRNQTAHFAKGNRFYDLEALQRMPVIRRFGNLGLSFLIKAASGYWSIFDPTNGYFAINSGTLNVINLDKLDKRYFFESSFLIELYYSGAIIEDVDIPARYGDEISNLSIKKTLLGFPPKLLKALFKRLILRYFVYDFSIFSIYLLVGLPLLVFGICFGFVKWIEYDAKNITAPTGTVMIAVLSIVLGFQLLLSVIQYDISSKMPYRSKKNSR